MLLRISGLLLSLLTETLSPVGLRIPLGLRISERRLRQCGMRCAELRLETKCFLQRSIRRQSQLQKLCLVILVPFPFWLDLMLLPCSCSDPSLFGPGWRVQLVRTLIKFGDVRTVASFCSQSVQMMFWGSRWSFFSRFGSSQ